MFIWSYPCIYNRPTCHILFTLFITNMPFSHLPVYHYALLISLFVACLFAFHVPAPSSFSTQFSFVTPKLGRILPCGLVRAPHDAWIPRRGGVVALVSSLPRPWLRRAGRLRGCVTLSVATEVCHPDLLGVCVLFPLFALFSCWNVYSPCYCPALAATELLKNCMLIVSEHIKD